MAHLRIIQDTINAESVGPRVIAKLATMTREGLDSTSLLRGKISAANAYEDDVTLLRSSHPELIIGEILPQNYYIKFADPNAEAACASRWGDSVGITAARAASITNLNRAFKNSSDELNAITTTFNEFRYFTGITVISEDNSITGLRYITEIDLGNIVSATWKILAGNSALIRVNNLKLTSLPGDAFNQCTNLEYIDLSTVTDFKSQAFLKCRKLNPTLSANVTNIGTTAFNGCSSFTNAINLPNLESIGTNSFDATKITSIVDLGKITILGLSGTTQGPFTNCTELDNVVLPATLQEINNMNFDKSKKMRWMKVLATTPPTIKGSIFNEVSSAQMPKIFVPDVNTYSSESTWSGFTQYLYPLSDFGTYFPNG